MICHRCNKTTGPFRQPKRRVYKDKVYETYYCVPCVAAVNAVYRARESVKQAVREGQARYRRRHDNKVRARRLAQKIPLQPCEVCGRLRAERHHDDYDKPLDVRFLCKRHHHDRHQLLRLVAA